MTLALRQLEPELLDTLPAIDPRAQRSRRDLRLVNALMGHRALLRRCLHKALGTQTPQSIVELGAGDGTLMLSLARDLAGAWSGVSVLLVDRQPAVQSATLAAVADIGWHIEYTQAELMYWLRQRPRVDVMLANLVMHHFNDTQLRELFSNLADVTDLFIAVEPRRSTLALLGSKALGWLGCNDVTRHDAVVSVRAGFTGRELSNLWPEAADWQLTERPAGLFSHLFLAQRIGSQSDPG